MRLKFPLALLAVLFLLVAPADASFTATPSSTSVKLAWTVPPESLESGVAIFPAPWKPCHVEDPCWTGHQVAWPEGPPWEHTFTGLEPNHLYGAKAFTEKQPDQELEFRTEPLGEVLWRGDASKPLGEQWETQSNDSFCSKPITGNFPNPRLSTEADSRFHSGTAIHFHMNAGDKTCFSGRSEILELGKAWPPLIEAGHEGWYAFQVLFPTDYPLNSENIYDGGVMQFHNYETHGTDGVPFGISVGRSCSPGSGKGTPHEGGPELGYMKAWIGVSESEGKYLRRCLSKEIHANQVYNVLIYAKFSKPTETTGIERIWLNGVKVDEYTGRFGLSTENPTSILHAGLYPDTSRAESPAMDLYEAGWTLATTREAAEANAF